MFWQRPPFLVLNKNYYHWFKPYIDIFTVDFFSLFFWSPSFFF